MNSSYIFLTITRKLVLETTHSLKELLGAPDWIPWGGSTNEKAITEAGNLPASQVGEVEITYFLLGARGNREEDIIEAYDLMGLKPVDPATMVHFFRKTEMEKGKQASHLRKHWTMWKTKGRWCHLGVGQDKLTGNRGFSIFYRSYGPLQSDIMPRYWAGVKK